ncbi:MAG: 4Fe-4S binding protein [Chloroflexi bacterium]|nr:4Fe-4S binding protein [Chloroflexota bacterium]
MARRLALPSLSDLKDPLTGRYDLLRIRLLRRVLGHRAFQYVLMVANLFFFAIIILSGLFGTPVGNRNFSIIFVWIVWWALLIMLLVPFGARLWCTMCPLPAVGEWAQRGSLVRRKAERPKGQGREWPKALRNIWLQNFSFVGVAMFSAIILTRPRVTGWLLLGFIVAGLVLSLLFRRRAFCRYVCPVSGFIGLYSAVAPIEVRARDPEVCLAHCGKECLRGSPAGHGCPWMEYPGTLTRNAYCGMCTECIKTCPTGNIALNVRPFGADLLVPVRHMDEAFKGFIMLVAALVYSTVLLGPWGWLKGWANLGSGVPLHYLVYIVGFLVVTLALTPGLFLGVCWASRRISGAHSPSLRQVFVTFSYATVPLGLMAWIAFTLSFVFINISYAIPLLSDPMGWGWDLLRTAHYPWTPYVPQMLPYLQVPILAGGLALSLLLVHRLALEIFPDPRHARRALLPVAVFLTAVTLLFLRLYLG